jgi:hypothetical protein
MEWGSVTLANDENRIGTHMVEGDGPPGDAPVVGGALQGSAMV